VPGWSGALLGLSGFRVLAVSETAVEVVIQIETTAVRVGCPGSTLDWGARRGTSRT
jgi:hypothetical protein